MTTSNISINIKNHLLIILAGLFSLTGILTVLLPKAEAAYFTKAFVRLDRMKASTPTTGRVCADPVSAGTENDVQVVFPSGFTVGASSNWTVTTTNLDTGQTAWPGISTGTASGQTVTFPSTDLTQAGAILYCFNWDNTAALTTSTAGIDKLGSITTRTVTPTNIDSSNYATAVIADDQIVVSATVPANFTFTLGGTTDTLGTLDRALASSSSAGKSVTIYTNANAGWITWAKDSNQGLVSALRSYTIATSGTVNGSPSTLSANSEGYVLDVDLTTDAASGGTVTIDGEYDGAANQGGTFSANYQPLASSNGGANGDVITLVEKASINALTKEATDYTDIITVVGAGQF